VVERLGGHGVHLWFVGKIYIRTTNRQY
jgi:hypothetical protein